MNSVAISTYLSLATNQPQRIQSFSEIYTNAVRVIPVNQAFDFSLTFKVKCNCARCIQPEPVVALPLHLEDSSDCASSLFANFQRLADMALLHTQQHRIPRNDACAVGVALCPTNGVESVRPCAKDVQKFIGSAHDLYSKSIVLLDSENLHDYVSDEQHSHEKNALMQPREGAANSSGQRASWLQS